MDIKETRELIRALAAVAIRTVAGLSDGKLSYFEMAAYLADIGKLRDGIQGIGDVPAELSDLDEAERDKLLMEIEGALVNAGLSHRISDIASKLLKWAYGTVQTVVEIKNTPPSALPA